MLLLARLSIYRWVRPPSVSLDPAGWFRAILLQGFNPISPGVRVELYSLYKVTLGTASPRNLTMQGLRMIVIWGLIVMSLLLLNVSHSKFVWFLRYRWTFKLISNKLLIEIFVIWQSDWFAAVRLKCTTMDKTSLVFVCNWRHLQNSSSHLIWCGSFTPDK